MIRIERGEVFGVDMPLAGTFRNAKATKTSEKSAVVRVTGTDGITGISSIELNSGRSPDDVFTIIEGSFAPALIWLDPTNVNKLLHVLDAVYPKFTHAKGAVEMACVDLAARSLGVPIYTYLGGAVREQLEFNAWKRETPCTGKSGPPRETPGELA